MCYKMCYVIFRVTQMGCYGLGVTRILQAGIEVLSDDEAIRWPKIISPYQICIIPQMVSLYFSFYVQQHMTIRTKHDTYKNMTIITTHDT